MLFIPVIVWASGLTATALRSFYSDKQQGPTVYSTGNYNQCPVINHNRKKYEKEYMCITESLCCAAEINTVDQQHFN